MTNLYLAFSTKDTTVPSIAQGRWIASLSDGSTIFENHVPGQSSAWTRLREYVALHKLDVTAVRLEAYGRRAITIPYRSEDGVAQINGYWQASRIGRFLDMDFPEMTWRGIGYVKGRRIYITWVAADGSISQEERDVFREVVDGERHSRQYDMGVILNDPI